MLTCGRCHSRGCWEITWRERNPRNKTGEQSEPERKGDTIKVRWKKYDLYQSGLYFRSYSETKRQFFLHISGAATLTSPRAKVAAAHILLKDIIVRASTEEELKCCSINNLKCCTLCSYKGRYEPTERDVQLQSKRIWASLSTHMTVGIISDPFQWR